MEADTGRTGQAATTRMIMDCSDISSLGAVVVAGCVVPMTRISTRTNGSDCVLFV